MNRFNPLSEDWSFEVTAAFLEWCRLYVLIPSARIGLSKDCRTPTPTIARVWVLIPSARIGLSKEHAEADRRYRALKCFNPLSEDWSFEA